jgi:Protein of unknown function/AsmA-like C-terminal region
MPEDANKPVNADSQPDNVEGATIIDMPVSLSREMVVVPRAPVPKRISVVTARRLAPLHETVVVAVALGGLIAGYFAWRLSEGTISISVAAPVVESALERIIGGETKIGALRLGWDKERRDFVVTANNITATTDARTSPLALGQVNLTLDARALLVGRAQITNAHLSGLQAVLVIDKLGRTAFGFGTPQEVLRLPLAKGETKGLRDLLDRVRKAVLPDGKSGRVEAIALTNARLIIIDPDTGEQLTLRDTRANVTTNAGKIVTMQAEGFASELGGFGNVAVSASADPRQRLVIAAVIDKLQLAKLPTSLRQGPLTRLNGATAPVSGHVLVQLGDQSTTSDARVRFSIGKGRFQGVDLKQASGALVWDGATGDISLTDVSANALQAIIERGNGRISGFKNGQRTMAFDAKRLAYSAPAIGDVSGDLVRGTARVQSDFTLISGVVSGDRLNFSRSDVANLQANGFNIAVASLPRGRDKKLSIGVKAQRIVGAMGDLDLLGTSIDATVDGLQQNNRFTPTQITVNADRFASNVTLASTSQAFDAKALRLTASQFDGQRKALPANVAFTAQDVVLGGAQSSFLNGTMSGVAFDGRDLASRAGRAKGSIARLTSNATTARGVSASGKLIVFDASQINSGSALLNNLTADSLNVAVHGISVGTTKLSASGTIAATKFSDATIGARSVEIVQTAQLPRPFWADDLRLRGSFNPKSVALEAFSLRHRGVDLVGSTTIVAAPIGSPRVDLVADVRGAFNVETLLSAWPRRFLPETRTSIARLVPSGTAQVSRLALAIPAGMRPKQILPRSGMDLAFSLSDVTVTYLPGMSPITGVSGQGTMTGNSLLLNLEQGMINAIELRDGVVEIAEFKPKNAHATIRATVDGDVVDMAREIDLPPLALLSKAKLSPDRLSGTGSAQLELDVVLKPALKPGDIGVAVSGDFQDAGLTRVFAGLDATRSSGRIKVAQNKIEVTGATSVAGNMFDFSWANSAQQNMLPETTLQAKGQVSISSLKELGFDLANYATGPVGLSVQSNSSGSTFGAAVINADFINTGIRLPGDLWNKSEGIVGTASANLFPREGGGWNVQDLRFDSAGATLRGALDLSDDAKLVDARFSRVIIPNAGDLAVNVTPADTGLTVTLRGEYLNLSPFLKTKNVSEQAVELFDRPLNLSADIKRVSTTQENSLTNVHADIVRDLQGWRTLAATGESAAGKSTIELMQKRDGRRSVSGVLSDAGFFAQLLYPGVPIFGGTGVIEGELPVVGANSSGMLTFTGKDITLARPGTSPIMFENVQLPMSVRGGVVTLRNGQADGVAYTVKASGYVDVGAGRLDLRGVATPGGLNRALADIPLFGAILGGGADEGLLGITFVAKGAMTAPRLSVNPVSALAPGFLRKLFESEAPLSPQPRLAVTTLAGDPIKTKWPYGPTEDMSERGHLGIDKTAFGPVQ